MSVDESAKKSGSEWAEKDGPGGEERVEDPAELWRIAGSMGAVRAEVDQLKALDDESLRTRLLALERNWRAELEAKLPSSVAGELHTLFDWLGEEHASGSELRLALVQLQGWLDGFISAMGVMVDELDELDELDEPDEPDEPQGA